MPWDRLAFAVVLETLRLYFADRAIGALSLRSGDIVREPGEERRYRITLLD